MTHNQIAQRHAQKTVNYKNLFVIWHCGDF